MRRLRRLPSPAMVVALIALFVALTGSAIASGVVLWPGLLPPADQRALARKCGHGGD